MSEQTNVAKPEPYFEVINGGIFVSVIYSVISLLAILIFAYSQQEYIGKNLLIFLFAVFGFIGGTIICYDREKVLDKEESLIVPKLLDNLMLNLWVADVILVYNFIMPTVGAQPGNIKLYLAMIAFLMFSMLGAVTGRAIFNFIMTLSSLPLWQFEKINEYTKNIDSDRTQLFLRAFIHTLVFILTIAFILILVFLFLFSLFMHIIIFVLSDDKNKTWGDLRPQKKEKYKRKGNKIEKDKDFEEIFYLNKDEYIGKDGIVRRKKAFLDEKTKRKVSKTGKLLIQNKWGGWKETGYRIKEDGSFVNEEGFFEKDIGVKLKKDYYDGHKIVKKGFIFDKETGKLINSKGEVKEEGFIFRKESDASIGNDGDVE